MVEFDEKQRELLADKLPDFANVAAGALLFGQFLSERTFSVPVALLGLGLWLMLFALGVGYRGRSL